MSIGVLKGPFPIKAWVPTNQVNNAISMLKALHGRETEPQEDKAGGKVIRAEFITQHQRSEFIDFTDELQNRRDLTPPGF
jgi:hypothetical protein